MTIVQQRGAAGVALLALIPVFHRSVFRGPIFRRVGKPGHPMWFIPTRPLVRIQPLQPVCLH